MIKYAALISILMVIGARSQRPPYAGSANRYPQVLPRFQDQTSTTLDPSVGNRVGGVGTSNEGTTAPSRPTTSTTPNPLPVAELGFADSIDWIRKLPEDQQPFWYINRHRIAEHLNPVGGRSQDNIPRSDVQTRSFFAG